MSEYVTHFRERDVELPKHRDNLLHAIEKDLLQDEHVLAVFYGGSVGNKKTDLYSDIDLRVVVKEEVFEAYRLDKKGRAANWGDVLFYEDMPWATYSTAHFRSFIKVDTFYYRVKDIQPSVWLQDIQIVHDTNEWMKDIVEQSLKLSYKPTVIEIEMWRTKFFAHVHEAYRRVKRNEIYYALHCLDQLRLLMTTAWYMELGIQPNSYGNWAKLEGNRSNLHAWQLVLLENWFSSREPEQIMQVIKSMFPAFKSVHKSLCETYGIDEDCSWMDEVLSMI